MACKAILVLCAQTLLVQFAFSQCIGPIIGAGLSPAFAYDGFAGFGCGQFTPAASTGGSFVVTSSSPIAPTGVSIISENVYGGALVAGGTLPLLGSVGVEGEFPTAGLGSVSYGCGSDAVAIVAEEGPIATGIVAPLFPAPGYTIAAGYNAAPFAYGPGYELGYGFGYGPGLGFGYGAGYGCEAVY